MVQPFDEARVLAPDQLEVAQQLRAARREPGRATALAAGLSFEQRLAGLVAHVVDRVPGALVAEARRLRGLRDRADAREFGQQRDAPRAREVAAVEAEPELGADGHRAWVGRHVRPPGCASTCGARAPPQALR